MISWHKIKRGKMNVIFIIRKNFCLPFPISRHSHELWSVCISNVKASPWATYPQYRSTHSLKTTREFEPEALKKWPCGPCRLMGPKFNKLAEEFPDPVYVGIDVDEQESIAASYDINVMPTFVFFKNGQKLQTIEGNNYEDLRKTVEQNK